MTSHAEENCRQMSENLLSKTKFKQQKIKEISQEVERRISKGKSFGTAQDGESPIVFEGDRAWKLTLAGPVASIIASKYEKPTFIFKKGDDISVGSVRSLKEGQNSVEAMKSCKDILITYGGHVKASGFRIKTENLEKFKNCLIQYFSK